MLIVHSKLLATSFFVTVNGNSSNLGTWQSPWDLSFALSRPTTVIKPGDTLWIRGGKYSGFFYSSLQGTAQKPVHIMGFPGERVILDAYTGLNNQKNTLSIAGNFSYFYNLEITNSSPNRISFTTTTPPGDIHSAEGLNFTGANSKIINCLVHNCPGVGIGYWGASLNSEVYGCLIYNNGYAQNNRGHGPSFYVQNNDETKPKAIRNNFIYNGFSTGIQFYASADKLRGLWVDSNTVFNSGSLTYPHQSRRANLLAGGETGGEGARVYNLVVTQNVFYRDTTDNSAILNMPYSTTRKNVELGFQSETLTDGDVHFIGNHVFGDPTPVLWHTWDTGSFKQNWIYAYKSNYLGNRQLIENFTSAKPLTLWDENRYFTNQPSFNQPFSGQSFSTWKNNFGIDSHSTFSQAAPTENAYFIRKNRFQPEKYYITILNYTGQNQLQMPFIHPELVSQFYSIYDIQQSYWKPIAEGVYNGSNLAFNLLETNVNPIIGQGPVQPKHTGKNLGTFIVVFYPEVQNIKEGHWHDPTIWSNGKIPNEYNRVTLNFSVNILANAVCRTIDTRQQALGVYNQSLFHILSIPAL